MTENCPVKIGMDQIKGPCSTSFFSNLDPKNRQSLGLKTGTCEKGFYIRREKILNPPCYFGTVDGTLSIFP